MLELRHIVKRYDYQKVLDDINIVFPECGIVSIIGPSGCGKSTLLNIIGGIDDDFQGDLIFDNKSVKNHLARYRRKHVSFIFQQFHLIMWLSVKENVALPQFFHPQEKQKIILDLNDLEKAKMKDLSLGQRQRLAYLRSRYHLSDILLCDEPTGSLDPDHSNQVMQLLKEESRNRLVILVSHNKELVEKYSDEIYEMKDGCIINHQVTNNPIKHMDKPKLTSKIHFSHLRLSISSFMSHKSRSFQLVFGLCVSLLCIAFTMTLSTNLEQELINYVYSLVPASSISFQTSNHESLTLNTLDQFNDYSTIVRAEMYLDDYELLGISFKGERYQESNTLFIGDDTSPYDDLQLEMGAYPSQNYEILVSLSTAKYLCQDSDLDELIGKKVYAWYQHELKVKAIEYKIVGITNQSTTLDTIYTMNHAYIYLLSDVYDFDISNVSASLGIIYVNKDTDRSRIIEQLEKDYPSYQFKEVGASTAQSISDTMEQVRMILLIFSFLAILSSLFLIGEVMFLNVVQKKKDLAIMKCFGASTFDIMRIVLYESLEIVLLAQIFSTILYLNCISLLNNIVSDVLLNDSFTFQADFKILAIVYILSYILIFISQIPPLLYVLKLNTVNALKE